MLKQPKNILVIRLSAMGDVAMTVPVLRALTHQYPDIKITVLTKAFFTPFFRDLLHVTVFPVDVKGKHKGVFGIYKLSRELNKENRFYAIADLHNVLRSQILRKLVKSKRLVTIDKGRKEKKALITCKSFKQLKTTHERYKEVFEVLGFKIDMLNPTFPKKVHLSKNIKAVLKLNNHDNQKLIGIAPFAAYEGKMYPLDLITYVIETLSKDYKIILFGGGEKEANILGGIEKSFKNVVNIAGKLSLNEELDVISNLDIMLSMDSGNAHIAAMLGVKVVTIWGVTHSYAGFAPFNQPEDYMLLSNREEFPLIPTSVYGNKYPENYKEASRSILPETIIKKIKSLV